MTKNDSSLSGLSESAVMMAAPARASSARCLVIMAATLRPRGPAAIGREIDPRLHPGIDIDSNLRSMRGAARGGSVAP